MALSDNIRESFFGLPIPGFELGLSERVGDFLGSGRTSEGGSNIIPSPQASSGSSNSSSSSSSPNYSSLNYSPFTPSATKISSGGNSQPSNTSGGSSSGQSYGDVKAAMESGQIPWDDNLLGSLFQPDLGGISDLYAPALAAADEAENLARSGAATDEENLNARVAKSSGDLETKRGSLLGETADEQTKFNETLREALAQAIRTFNGLRQQGISRFGGGNSGAQAIGELVAQEFMRQQGQIGNRRAEGELQFTKERSRINEFVDSSVKDLDLYKNEAIDEIRKTLNTTVAEINARRGDIEANKSRDKMGALEDARNRIMQVEQADKEFRRGLFMEAISNMQQVEGRVFTPEEIMAQLSDFESRFSGEKIAPTGAATGTSPAASALAAKNTNQEDEFAGLNTTQQLPSTKNYVDNIRSNYA